jgi:hypothetical protein
MLKDFKPFFFRKMPFSPLFRKPTGEDKLKRRGAVPNEVRDASLRSA